MGLHTSGHTRKNSSFSTQDEHLVLLGLEALTDGPQPPLRDTLYLAQYIIDEASYSSSIISRVAPGGVLAAAL